MGACRAARRVGACDASRSHHRVGAAYPNCRAASWTSSPPPSDVWGPCMCVSLCSDPAGEHQSRRRVASPQSGRAGGPGGSRAQRRSPTHCVCVSRQGRHKSVSVLCHAGIVILACPVVRAQCTRNCACLRACLRVCMRACVRVSLACLCVRTRVSVARMCVSVSLYPLPCPASSGGAGQHQSRRRVEAAGISSPRLHLSVATASGHAAGHASAVSVGPRQPRHRGAGAGGGQLLAAVPGWCGQPWVAPCRRAAGVAG